MSVREALGEVAFHPVESRRHRRRQRAGVFVSDYLVGEIHRREQMPEHVVVVFFRLRHPARLVQFGQRDGEKAERVHHPNPASGIGRGERPQKFLSRPFGGRARKQRRVAPNQSLGGFVYGEPGFGGQAHRPEQPNGVVREHRIARRAQDAFSQVSRAAERVSDAPIIAP